MKPPLPGLANAFQRLSPATALFLGLLGLALVALVDLSAPALNASLLYVLGVAFVGWVVGRRAAVALAAIVAGWLAWHDQIAHSSHPTVTLIAVWNAVSTFCILAGTGWLAAEVARLTRRLSNLVEERTANWKREAEEHRATSDRLAEALERFEQVTDNITEVFWLSTVDKNQVIYVSPGYERIWGRPCDDLYRNPRAWLDCVHPDEREQVRQAALADQMVGAYDVQYRIVRPDGATRWVRDHAFPVRDSQGQVYRIAGICQDITERKRAEVLLQLQRDVSASLSELADLPAALHRILRIAIQIEGVDCGGIYLLDPATHELRLTAWLNLSPEFAAAVACYPLDAPHTRLLLSHQPMYTVFGELGSPPPNEELLALAILPLVHEGTLHGAMNLASHRHREIPAASRSVIEAIAAQASGAIARLRAEDALHRLQSQLLEIADRQQARIGQDLHDGLCQQLVSLAFDANLLEERLQAGRSPDAQLAHRLAQLLDAAITESRHLSRGLFPVRVEAEGLVSALEELAASTRDRFGIPCTFTCPDPIPALGLTTDTHLYRIAQEAVTNAVKHAQPKHIHISLVNRQDGIELHVRDDGTGMPIQKAPSGTAMGLQIMRHRVRTIGAALDFSTPPGGGTIVCCRCPIAAGGTPSAGGPAFGR